MKKVLISSVTWKVLGLLFCIILIAANLRAPITSVGPVIPEIAGSLHLSPTAIGLFSAVPLICFSLFSTFMPRFSMKAGLERLLLCSLLLLSFGIIIRSTGSVLYLFAGSVFIGIAITIGNVLMPAFIKKKFPDKGGTVTGVYLFSMNIASAFAVGYSLRLGVIGNMGWRGSLGIWFVPALITFLVWIPLAKKGKRDAGAYRNSTALRMWKSRLAWQISIFMGLQSIVFYALAAWLPTMLRGWGMDAEKAGWMLSYLQMGQVPMMIIGPLLADRMKNQRLLIWVTFAMWIAGLSLMILFKTKYILAAILLTGASVGLAFALATVFFILRTKNVNESAALSGMAQSVGYFEAALAPPVFGILFDLTHSWLLPLILLLAAGIVLLFTGLYSARNRYV